MATARERMPGVEARAGKFPGPSLIPALYAIQERVGWLPREELVALAREVHRPLYEIEGLISFYPHFLTEPPRRVTLHACRDLSCWLQGADDQIVAIRQRYGQDADTEITEVSCIGRCDAAPAVSVNECPAAASGAETLIAAVRAGKLPPAPVRSYADGGRWPNDPYGQAAERYGVLRAVLAGELEAARVTAALQDSGLRGMGGAGFPAGRKWDLVAAQEATPKYVICNADESEPGTFKDRQILAEQPHLVLEGMLLGMLAVGAEEGWVFIRHEYGPEEKVIRQEIEFLRGAGLVGAEAGSTGRRLSVEVFTSPGGYILGEESALIECMEGHRGEPRNKPPFPGVYGLWGKPTLMNSVETFAHVPVIASRGAGWWKQQGIGDALRAEVLRGIWPRRAPRRLLRADGHHRPAAARAGRGSRRRQAAGCDPAGRRVVELPRARPARRAARLRRSREGWVNARVGRAGGDGGGYRPACRGHERAAVLPRRVVRQVRALPGRLQQGPPDAHRPARGRRRARRRG